MNELSLFSGAGGGLLGTLLLGWKHIGYVEYDDYCQRVIAQRIEDGILPVAPIFGDVREFLQSGAAAEYRGFVDVVTGGFPCQPFSVAGKRAGADDSRNMWPATIECIRVVRPRFCLLENVPGILASGYFGTILGDLAESGYDCRWRILSAAELGAPHRRDRLWICAYATHDRRIWNRDERTIASTLPELDDFDAVGAHVAHTNGGRGERTQQEVRPGWHVAELGGQDVAHAQGARNGGLEQGNPTGKRCEQSGDGGRTDAVSNAVGYGLEGQQQGGAEAGPVDRPGNGCDTGWWETEPGLGRLADGLPNRMERLRAAGNAQVPAVAATAWRLLTADLELAGSDEAQHGS